MITIIINKHGVCLDLLAYSLIVNSYLVPIVGLIIILSSFVDNIILPSFLNSYQSRSSSSTLTYFALLYVGNAVLQFLIVLSIFKMNLFKGQSENSKKFYHVLMIAAVVFVFSSLLSLILQLILHQSYSVFTFIFIVASNLAISSTIVTILLLKLSLWLKSNKNLYVFFYVISFSMLLLSLISSAIGLIQELVARHSPITPIPNPWDRMSTLEPITFDMYRISSMLSFAFIWIATSYFLKNYVSNYSKRTEKWKYWVLATLPLIYYIITSDFVINNVLNLLIFQYPSFSNTIFYLLGSTKQIGGLFFALPLFFMAKNAVNTNLKYYLSLSATGIMILYSSIQISTLNILPYPPFGLVTLSTIPISSYLILIGLYYSAKSVSNDRKLLQRLRKQIKNESISFLSAIGSAEWNKNLELTVHNLSKKVEESKESTNSNLKEDDIRRYIVDMMDEIKKKKSNAE